MGSDNNAYWELASGGSGGSVILDASLSTAIVTGLQCGLINVRSAAQFSILTGSSILTTGSITFTGTNIPTGVAVEPGLLWPGYARLFTAIQIISGQISYYEKRDD